MNCIDTSTYSFDFSPLQADLEARYFSEDFGDYNDDNSDDNNAFDDTCMVNYDNNQENDTNSYKIDDKYDNIGTHVIPKKIPLNKENVTKYTPKRIPLNLSRDLTSKKRYV
jgi:hypothetical protein